MRCNLISVLSIQGNAKAYKKLRIQIILKMGISLNQGTGIVNYLKYTVSPNQCFEEFRLWQSGLSDGF